MKILKEEIVFAQIIKGQLFVSTNTKKSYILDLKSEKFVEAKYNHYLKGLQSVKRLSDNSIVYCYESYLQKTNKEHFFNILKYNEITNLSKD